MTNKSAKRPGYVYLLHDKRDDKYKIGRTNNLTKRISALKTGNPNPLVLIAYAICNDVVSTEKKFHYRFAAKRLPKGEWFKLSEDDINHIKESFRKQQINDAHERNIDRFF